MIGYFIGARSPCIAFVWIYLNFSILCFWPFDLLECSWFIWLGHITWITRILKQKRLVQFCLATALILDLFNWTSAIRYCFDACDFTLTNSYANTSVTCIPRLWIVIVVDLFLRGGHSFGLWHLTLSRSYIFHNLILCLALRRLVITGFDLVLTVSICHTRDFWFVNYSWLCYSLQCLDFDVCMYTYVFGKE